MANKRSTKEVWNRLKSKRHVIFPFVALFVAWICSLSCLGSSATGSSDGLYMLEISFNSSIIQKRRFGVLDHTNADMEEISDAMSIYAHTKRDRNATRDNAQPWIAAIYMIKLCTSASQVPVHADQAEGDDSLSCLFIGSFIDNSPLDLLRQYPAGLGSVDLTGHADSKHMNSIKYLWILMISCYAIGIGLISLGGIPFATMMVYVFSGWEFQRNGRLSFRKSLYEVWSFYRARKVWLSVPGCVFLFLGCVLSTAAVLSSEHLMEGLKAPSHVSIGEGFLISNGIVGLSAFATLAWICYLKKFHDTEEFVKEFETRYVRRKKVTKGNESNSVTEGYDSD